MSRARRPAAAPLGRRLRSALVGVALLVVMSGCRLTVDLDVSVAPDGSGTVEVVLGVDRDALAKIGGDLTPLIDADALRADGWVIDGPTEEPDGFTRVHLRHPFATPAAAADIFEKIAGDTGPFRGFRVTRDRSLTETRWAFAGSVDFAAGLDALGEAGPAPQVDGEPLGRTVEELEAQLGDSLSRLVQVRVRARLPGSVTSNATTKAANGAVWQIGFGEGAVDLEAVGTQRRTATFVIAGLAGVAVLVLLVLVLVRLAGRVSAVPRR